MRNKVKIYWTIIKQTFSEFLDDNVLKLSAALAYYTVFSLPAMLLILISVSGIFLGKDAIQGKLFWQINQYVGNDAGRQIQDILSKIALSENNVIATIIGAVMLVISATGIFGEIQDSINSIWGLRTKPKKGLIKLVLNRLLSFSMILVLGFVLVVSLVLNSLLDAFIGRLDDVIPESILQYAFIINYILIIGVVSTLFAGIFKVLPDAHVKWKDVYRGAFFTTFLFILGKFLISYYLQQTTVIASYGGAGSLIILLLWVYYSAMILYLGAEFTQVYAQHLGSAITPNDYAEWIVKHSEQAEGSVIKKPASDS